MVSPSPQAMALSRLSERLSRAISKPVHWLTMSVVCLVIDYWLGPEIQFPLVYLLPVSLASWYGGISWGMTLAVMLPLFRLYFTTIWVPASTSAESVINAAIRIAVFVTFAWLVSRTSRQMRELRHLPLLEGMLGVCSSCKKIEDSRHGAWQPLDDYVASHPEEFTRQICPTCAKQAGEVFDRR